MTKDSNNKVVYMWVREDNTPYYVGIGNPRRPYTGKRCCGNPPPRERILVLHKGLNWEEACKIEKELISLYGRKDLGTGILRNLTDGGDGALNLSEKTRESISQSKRGKPRQKETREKISESVVALGLSGEKHPLYGKKLSKEHREKLSTSHRGKKLQESTKRKMSESRTGRTLSEETRRKISEAHKGRVATEKHKENMSKARKKLNLISDKSCHYRPRNWYHPEHGVFLQKSLTDLVRMFPEQELLPSNLSLVANGKRFHHKKWTIVHENQLKAV